MNFKTLRSFLKAITMAHFKLAIIKNTVMMRVKQTVWFFLLSVVFTTMQASTPAMTPQQRMIYEPAPDEGLLGAAIYYSKMTNNLMNQVVRFNYQFADVNVYSAEINYRFAPSNPLTQFFDQFKAKFEINGNITYQDDPIGSIYEFTPYFNVRWIQFPWNRYLTTTFAIGEGASYATALPWRERRDDNKAVNGKRLENYLMVEATASLPSRPDWQLIYRIHHRSGVFGMYDSSTSGSTTVGIGIRHYFE